MSAVDMGYAVGSRVSVVAHTRAVTAHRKVAPWGSLSQQSLPARHPGLMPSNVLGMACATESLVSVNAERVLMA